MAKLCCETVCTFTLMGGIWSTYVDGVIRQTEPVGAVKRADDLAGRGLAVSSREVDPDPLGEPAFLQDAKRPLVAVVRARRKPRSVRV